MNDDIKLKDIDYYNTDSGRVSGGYGNTTGQPTTRDERGRVLYPSPARSAMKKNPLWRGPGSVLPEYIPADLAEQIQNQMADELKNK